MLKWWLAAIAFCVVATGAGAQQNARPVLYVGNSFGNDITVINVTTQKVIATIPVGQTVHAICAQADGRKVFTTIEAEHALKVIDTATNQVTDTIALPGQPNQCAATADGHYVLVPILAPQNFIAIVDMTQKKIVKTLPSKHPHNCFTPEGGSDSVVYCEELNNFRIDRIDMKTMEYTDQIPVGGEPRPFIVTQNEKTLYTAISGLHGVAIIDLSGKTIQEVVLPPMPYMACKAETPNTPTHGIALTPDRRKLWITSVADGGLYIYDTREKRLSAKIAVGTCPNWITISQDGRYAAVSNADSDDASIFDARREKELARVKVGSGPKRLLIVDVPPS